MTFIDWIKHIEEKRNAEFLKIIQSFKIPIQFNHTPIKAICGDCGCELMNGFWKYHNCSK